MTVIIKMAMVVIQDAKLKLDGLVLEDLRVHLILVRTKTP